MGFFGDIITSLIPGGQQISDIAAALVGFFTAVTNYKMWRSLGWLLLGLGLMAFGLNLWLKNPVGKIAGKAGKAAATAAVL